MGCSAPNVEFRRLCEVAAAHGGIVIDDIVPGHTGKGADFRLAEMRVGDYPGIYHMVEIPPEDWHLLPEVPAGKDSVNLDGEAEDRLERAGYIVGRLQRVIFQDPGVKDTNWSATAPVTGPDGVERRWVYLHYFKDGQPSINWLDPTFAGMRLVIGDALHSLGDLGAGALRLDANGFLGVEKSAEGGAPAWSEGHPLSEAVNQLIASMVRKVGGFTFQELNLSIDDIKKTSERGADLSYDFVNRPAYVHAMATGDTEFLRLTLNAALQHGLQPVRLVHALQNHDEMTYELVHFATAHKDDIFRFRGAELTGGELAVKIRSELIERLTGEAAPYNATFTTNGIASTTATIIAAALGYTDLTNLSPGADREDQAGPPAPGDVQRMAARRVRGVRLGPVRNADPGAVQGLPAAGIRRHPLDPPGSLRPDGLPAGGHRVTVQDAAWYRACTDPCRNSCRTRPRLRHGCATCWRSARRYGISTSVQVDVPEVSDKAMLVMVHLLDTGQIQVTVLNFSSQSIAGRVKSEHLTPGGAVIDMFTDQVIAEVDHEHTFAVSLEPHQGMALLTVPVDVAGPPSRRQLIDDGEGFDGFEEGWLR